MSVGELDGRAHSALGSPTPEFIPPVSSELPAHPLPIVRARKLLGIVLGVLAVDWSSKAMAWRRLPGRAMINADTSGALPILPGLVSHPVLGGVVDAAALMLLVIGGLWLARSATLGPVAWTGSALTWAGVASNALDRWGGHLLLAPGSQRGVVDWIPVADSGPINLADVAIGVGLLLAIAGLAATRVPGSFRGPLAAAVLLLIPFSMLTAGGTSSNAEPEPTGPTFQQRVRATMWVGPSNQDQRVLWRGQGPGWNVFVQAADKTGLVLAQWHLPSDSEIAMVYLPKGTDTVYVVNDNGFMMTLAHGLS